VELLGVAGLAYGIEGLAGEGDGVLVVLREARTSDLKDKQQRRR
jgi:hypothetical protein